MQFKTFKYFSMAALALMTAACSNEDNDIPEGQQPVSGIPFTATISTGSSAMTRALSGPDAEGKITASWVEKEQVALIYTVGETKYNTTATVSSVDSETGRATITATLQDGVTDNTSVTLIYPASAVDDETKNVKQDLLTAQDGTLATIATNYDVRKGTGAIAVSGGASSLKEDVTLDNQYAIWKLTLDQSCTTVTVISSKDGVLGSATLASAGTECYLAVKPTSEAEIRLLANNGSDYYTMTHTGVTLAASKYYQSTVTTTKLTTVDVSEISSYAEIADGTILTGEYSGNNDIIINTDATVILKDVTITNTSKAGLICDDSATIILVGENRVTGGDGPGIKAAESSASTLTITGTGSLVATGGELHAGIGSERNSNCGNITISGGTVTATGGNWAAGIGMGYIVADLSCGAITISGGTVTATGGEYAAGIGTGNVYEGSSTCGAITISGGTVTAQGGNKAAGIGTGWVYFASLSCPEISITTGVTKVTATRGGDTGCCIGKGYINSGGTCTIGTITIGGTVYADGISDDEFVYQP